MKKIPQPMPGRSGWLCEPAPGGSFVGWPAESRPSIQANHIDGPVVFFRNGEMHWLTIWERLLFAFGRLDVYSLEQKHRPHLAALGR